VRGQTGKGANLSLFGGAGRPAQQADKKAEVVFSGLLFFGYFLLEEQKKVT